MAADDFGRALSVSSKAAKSAALLNGTGGTVSG